MPVRATLLLSSHERLSSQLFMLLSDDELDEQVVSKQAKKLLEAENELKLYQLHVRISLLSKLSAEQRQAARIFAKKY